MEIRGREGGLKGGFRGQEGHISAVFDCAFNYYKGAQKVGAQLVIYPAISLFRKI